MERNQNFEAITYPSLHQLPNQVIIQKLPSIRVFWARSGDCRWPGAALVFLRVKCRIAEPVRAHGIRYHDDRKSLTNLRNRRSIAHRRRAAGYDGVQFQRLLAGPEYDVRCHRLRKLVLRQCDNLPPVSSCSGYPTCPPQSNTAVALASSNLFRKDVDFTLDLRLPRIERVYTPPKWLHLGEKAKHVIEAEATYEYVTGINQFQKFIHFDATDILSDTNQLTYSLTNRLYKKDKNGNVSEVVTWRLTQARYFDPTFGGAVVPNQGACAYNAAGTAISQNPTCQRVVVFATEELTPFSFLDGPRDYSPVVSSLVFNPYSFFSLEYRADYDPLRHKIVNQTLGGSVRHSKYFGTLSDTAISTNPILIPQENQISFGGGYGNSTRKGWNVAGSVFYDALLNRRLFDLVQTSYNTDCCGFSFELRNFNLGIRQENQYLFSFSVANIGTFGSLQKQARIF